MKYQVGDVVYASVVGEILKIEKDRFTGKVTYKIFTTDASEVVEVNETHIDFAPTPEELGLMSNKDYDDQK